MIDKHVRIILMVMVLCWALTAGAYFGISNTRRWHPEVVGAFAAFAAVTTAVVALRPRTVWAYRLGGTLAVGALMLRTISVFMGLFLFVDRDAVWISISSLAATTMVAVLYWVWWLDEVKAWHEDHKQLDRRRRDPR